jgi:TATA-binding protein-associated factor Taf7
MDGYDLDGDGKIDEYFAHRNCQHIWGDTDNDGEEEPDNDEEVPENEEETPADAEKEAEKKLDPEAQEALAIQKFVDHLREKETGNIARLKTMSKVINMVLKDSEPEDFKNFFSMLKSLAVKKLQQGNPKKEEK